MEPITHMNGKMATPYFFQNARRLAKDHNVPFIVDETKTGLGITGKMWGYEHWYLEDSPDLVVFGGATQVSGVFSSREYRSPGKLSSPADLTKINQLGKIIDVIRKKDLIWKTGDTSSFLKIELERMRKKNDYYSSVRGNGNHLAFDVHDE